MTVTLAIFLALLIGLAMWKHVAVMRFFHRPAPAWRRQPALVSLLQPILSGDPTLPATLGHNLRLAGPCPVEFIWLVDADDAEGQAIAQALQAQAPAATIRVLIAAPPPQGANPKTFKLIHGLESARGDVLCVLDDDTMLPEGWQQTCLPYLDAPGVGLAFGLPYQVNFANLWSSLIAYFVNSNSLLTYIPYTTLHAPLTINGMFYAIRREVLAHVGGFDGLESVLADDFAVAQRMRSAGYSLAQTPLRHAISTQVTGARRYLGLIQRWFIFPRESIMRHLPWREQVVVYGLTLLPALGPLVALIGLIRWPSWWVGLLLGGYLLYSYAIFAHFNIAYLRRASPWARSWLVIVLQLVFPLQLLAALLLPQRIVWRGHVMAVEKGGGFRYLKRR